ncbi:MAG: phage tail tape measure protein, partial [Desulfobacteria bacterium]
MQIVVDLQNKASKELDAINKKFVGVSKGATKLAAGFAVVAGAAALGAVAIAAKVSVSAFRDFEEGMAGVAKTTGMSGDALAELGNGIKEMAKTIPVAHTELADIAAVAGQLGIQGKKDILAFTKTASEVAVAFDIPAEKAATVMAKLTNIYGLGIDQASNLASAINVLGNTTAAAESQISDYAMSLGAAAEQMGFSATESMAMGATLISMGMDASDAGTRLNSAFTAMSKKTGEVADFLGMTEKAFRKAFSKDQMGMIMKIVEKLSKIKDPLERAKVASEMFGTVGAKAINGLGGNLEGLQTNLDNSAKGFEENTSLAEEFAAKTNTLNASFQLLKNSLTGVAINIGEKLAPYVSKLVKGFIELIPKIEAFASMLYQRLTPAIEAAKHIFENIKYAALEFFSALGGGGEAALSGFVNIINRALTYLAKLSDKFIAILPTIISFAVIIKEKLISAFKFIGSIITKYVIPALSKIGS